MNISPQEAESELMRRVTDHFLQFIIDKGPTADNQTWEELAKEYQNLHGLSAFKSLMII